MLKKLFRNKEKNKQTKEIEKLKTEINELKQENKKLKTQGQFKEDLISSISHEFKNPVTIINGYIETILASPIEKSLQEKFLKKIHNNTLRLSGLIDRLYFLLKIENNKYKLHIASFRLDLAIKEISENFDEKRLVFNIKPISINADKYLIQTVISNLLSNAFKYSNDKIIINMDNEKVEIIDKGIGIEPKNINLIKQKFYRIAKNDWDNSLGLGLYLVEKILKLHHTKLEIKSKKHKGSNFYFYITSLQNKEHPV